jgi:phosphatidylglycerol:prolipoprotein diacylglycerol transferase
MRRVLFRWRGVTVWSYPAMLYIGLVIGTTAGNVAAHAAGIDALRTYAATLLLIPAALFGSRLLFVAQHWRYFHGHPKHIWGRSDGGAAMYGGLFLSLALSVPLLVALDVPFGAFWDVTTFTILVGMIFTRIGCLLNGCCAGRVSHSWGSLYLPGCSGAWEKRIPTQCLEAAWAAVLAALATLLWKRMPFPGALFLTTTAAYAAGRLPLESAREREAGSSRFTLHHALSLLMIVASLAALAICWPE